LNIPHYQYLFLYWYFVISLFSLILLISLCWWYLLIIFTLIIFDYAIFFIFIFIFIVMLIFSLIAAITLLDDFIIIIIIRSLAYIIGYYCHYYIYIFRFFDYWCHYFIIYYYFLSMLSFMMPLSLFRFRHVFISSRHDASWCWYCFDAAFAIIAAMITPPLFDITLMPYYADVFINIAIFMLSLFFWLLIFIDAIIFIFWYWFHFSFIFISFSFHFLFIYFISPLIIVRWHWFIWARGASAGARGERSSRRCVVSSAVARQCRRAARVQAWQCCAVRRSMVQAARSVRRAR